MSVKKNLKEPTMKDLEEIAKRDGIPVSEEELKQFTDALRGCVENYRTIDDVDDCLLPVKYPRLSVHKPSKEENPFNAWWYKTDIKGTSSGKLLGKRIAIKDCILVAGVPMCCGSRLLEDYVPNEDATVVTRVLDAGAHIVGKTNCEDLCKSANSYTCVEGPVLNPYDKTRTSGGSSSGNAVVIQQNEADMAIGGDQGGSIRIPSSCCGIVGLKPTHGLVPYTGAMAYEPVMDNLGPMAGNVKDCALLLEVIAGYDNGYDPRQRCDIEVPEYSKLLTGDISGKKLALLKESWEDCEEDVIMMVKEALSQLSESCGVVIEEVSIPRIPGAFSAIPSESAFVTSMEYGGAMQGVRGYQNVDCIDHMSAGLQNKKDQYTIIQKWSHIQGTYLKENNGMHFVAKANNLLLKYTKDYNDVLEKYPVILMPTMKCKALKISENVKTLKEELRHMLSGTRNTYPYNLTGHPALSMNVGFSEGLPIGLQIVGKHWDETTVLNVAYAFEKNLKL